MNCYSGYVSPPSWCLHCIQWTKRKIRAGGTLLSALGLWQWSCAFITLMMMMMRRFIKRVLN